MIMRGLIFRVITAILVLSAVFDWRALYAQQNLFNVPNGEITVPGKWFFQEQINASATAVQSNTTIDYGIADQLEVGLNLFFLNTPTNSPVRLHSNALQDTLPIAPLALANVQKGYHARDWLHFSAGAQAGANLGDAQNTGFAYLAYGTMVLRETYTHSSFHFGLYHGNIAYNGSGDGAFMGGAEIPFLWKKLHFVADVIQGSHANAVFVPGVVFFFTETIALSVGWQKPFPSSATEQAAVFELSLY